MSEEEKQVINVITSKKDLYMSDLIDISKCDAKIVLNLIEKLQKENGELKQENKRIKYCLSNLFIGDYILKNEVKNLIKKLNKEIRNCDTIEAVIKIKQQQILQELLKSGDENECKK